jgi:hypothetical protein
MKETKGTPRKKSSIIERVLHLAFELSHSKRLVKMPVLLLGALKSHRFNRWGTL